MLISRQIDELVYAKHIIGLAERWICLGRIEDASAMVCELTEEYLTQDLPKQMIMDEDFMLVALDVAATLAALPMDLDDDDVALATLLLEKPVAKA